MTESQLGKRALPRRNFLTGVGAVGLTAFLAACGSDESGGQTTSSSTTSSNEPATSSTTTTDSSATAEPKPMRAMNFNLGFLPLGRYAMYYYGVEQGIYAKHGVDLTIEPSNGTAATLSQLMAGQTDCGFIPASALVQASSEPDTPVARTYATIYQANNNTLFFYTSSGIAVPKDLEGRSITTSAGANEQREFPLFAAANGIDESKISWDVVDASLKLSQLIRKDTEVTSQSIFGLAQLRAQVAEGDEIGYFMYGDHGVAGVGSGLVMTEKFVSENAELAEDFVQATLEAYQATFDNPQAAAESMAKSINTLEVDTAVAEIDIVKLLAFGSKGDRQLGLTPEADYEAVVTQLTDSGVDVSRAYTDFFTNDFVAS